MFNIHNSKPDDWYAGENDIINLVKYSFIKRKAGKSIKKACPENWENENNLLIKHISDQIGVSPICLSSMNQEKGL